MSFLRGATINGHTPEQDSEAFVVAQGILSLGRGGEQNADLEI